MSWVTGIRFRHAFHRLGWIVLVAGCLRGADDEALLTDSTHVHTGRTLAYGDEGLEYESPGTGTFLWLGLRLQGRYDTLPGNPTEAADLEVTGTSEFDLRRGRIKGGGHLFREWLQIYAEYDFPSDTLLDYKLTLRPNEWVGFRVGQWKAEFNRERIDSSGKQQFVDRSLSNYWFTLDRQPGVAAAVRLWPESRVDSTVYVEYLGGEGRGGGFGEGSGLTLVRWQWNSRGEVLDFSQADLKRRDQPVSAVTVAGVSGNSPYTRYSGSGGAQLPGYGAGDYHLSQLMFETAWQWRGWSWQQELHWKEIEDRGTGGRRTLWGGYAQAGWFPPAWQDTALDPMELVGRIAFVEPDRSVDHDQQWAYSVGSNWYINGHRSKVSADLTALDFADPLGGASGGVRFRLQWDVSF